MCVILHVITSTACPIVNVVSGVTLSNVSVSSVVYNCTQLRERLHRKSILPFILRFTDYFPNLLDRSFISADALTIAYEEKGG